MDERRRMDEQTRIELDYIKKAIDNININLQRLIDREESRVSRMVDIEKDVVILQRDCDACKNSQNVRYDEINQKLSELKAAPDKNRMQWQSWVAIIGGIISIIIVLVTMTLKLGGENGQYNQQKAYSFHNMPDSGSSGAIAGKTNR